jgi:hypothetical protein
MLLDELRDLAKRSDIPGCKVAGWLAAQDKDFQEVFVILQNSPHLNLTEALNLIQKYQPDLPFKRTSFVHHMRGNCTCPKA